MTFYRYMDIVGATMVFMGIFVFLAFVAHHLHKQRKEEVDTARDLGFSEGFDSGFQSGMSALHPDNPVTEVFNVDEVGI